MMFQGILFPTFVQVGLTFVLLFWMAGLRTRDVRSGAVKPQSVSLREPLWPARTTQIAYAFSNQFEVPMLFYVLVALLIAMRHADLIQVLLAWVFVVTRLVHAGIFTTSNTVLYRGQAYAAGVIVLFIMWVMFAIEILLGT